LLDVKRLNPSAFESTQNKQQTSRYRKKSYSKLFAKYILSESFLGKSFVDQNLCESFTKAKKQDDLADSLVHICFLKNLLSYKFD
jgi:hypothetical protein